MIADLEPYPEYRDSGLPWLGHIPGHWGLVPNRGLVRRRKVLVGKRHGDYRLLSLTKQGVIVRDISTGKGKFSADMGTSQEVRCGDLVFCLFDVPETPRTVGLSRHAGMITGAYTVFECKSLEIAEYFELYYRAMDDRKLLSPLYSGLRNTIPAERFLGTKTPQPPPDEQGAIVRFLNWANARLERAIRAKRKVITLLNEQKQAIIDRAVTRGLDDPVGAAPPRNPVTTAIGRIPWLTSVPEHWDFLPSRQLFSVRKELALPGDVQLSATQAYGVVPQAEFEQKVGRRVVKISMHLEKRRHVEKDDFVISMRSFQGGLERAWASGCIRSSYVVLRPIVPIDVGYFSYLLKSQGYIQALQATSNFIRDGQDLNYDNFCLVDLPVPPMEEQKAIANSLDQTTVGIIMAIDRERREVNLLREYRTRLIADAVTGKLDVRKAAARVPDEAAPEKAEDDTDLSETEPADEETVA